MSSVRLATLLACNTSKTSVGWGRDTDNFTRRVMTLGRCCATAGPAPEGHQSNRTPHSSNTLLTLNAMGEVHQTAPTQQETQCWTPLTCVQTADRQVVDGRVVTHSLQIGVECSEGLGTFPEVELKAPDTLALGQHVRHTNPLQ